MRRVSLGLDELRVSQGKEWTCRKYRISNDFHTVRSLLGIVLTFFFKLNVSKKKIRSSFFSPNNLCFLYCKKKKKSISHSTFHTALIQFLQFLVYHLTRKYQIVLNKIAAIVAKVNALCVIQHLPSESLSLDIEHTYIYFFFLPEAGQAK